MNIYIPMTVFHGAIAIALWLTFGWLSRTVTFIFWPGMTLGLSRGQARNLLLLGPLGFLMFIYMYWQEWKYGR